jgi:hypothetical protein
MTNEEWTAAEQREYRMWMFSTSPKKPTWQDKDIWQEEITYHAGFIAGTALERERIRKEITAAVLTNEQGKDND